MGMTTLEAANILALSPGQVAHLCKTGKLKARKFGPLWEISSESLAEFKRSHRPTAGRKPRVRQRARVHHPGEEYIELILGELGVLNSLNALEQKIHSTNPLLVFESAGLMIKLLCGDHPEIVKLGRNIPGEIRFKVGRFFSAKSQSPPFTGTHRLIQSSFDPASIRKAAGIRMLNLAEFLGCKLLMTRGRYYTLKEILLFEADVLADVRPMSLQKQLEAFHRISELISPGGITPAARQLKAIGRVTLGAIEPYREQIGVEWHGFEQPAVIEG